MDDDESGSDVNKDLRHKDQDLCGKDEDVSRHSVYIIMLLYRRPCARPCLRLHCNGSLTQQRDLSAIYDHENTVIPALIELHRLPIEAPVQYKHI